jgi:hypothetical protein
VTEKEYTINIAANSDDAHQIRAAGTCYIALDFILSSSQLNPDTCSDAGFRFVLPETIPQGAEILEAYLQVYVYSTTYDDPNLNLYCQLAASPPTFTDTNFDISNRPRTEHHTPWVASGIGTGWKNSPSLVTQIQEIIDAYSATAIVIIAWSNSDAAKNFRTRSKDYSDTYRAKLYIRYQYQAIEQPSVQTDQADNIGTDTATLHGTLLDDGGEACEVRFSYGIKPTANQQTEWQEGKESEATFEQELTDLEPNTVYVAYAVAQNSAGETAASTIEFTTLAGVPPPPPPIKVMVTHPAIKSVTVYDQGYKATSYENISNLDEQRIQNAIELPVQPPATIEVESITGRKWTFVISLDR